MNEFTPAPWFRYKDRHDDSIVASDGIIGNIICDAPSEGKLSIERWEANVHLIAAAPDIYEALQKLVKASPFKPTATGLMVDLSFEDILLAQQALAKANGEQ